MTPSQPTRTTTGRPNPTTGSISARSKICVILNFEPILSFLFVFMVKKKKECNEYKELVYETQYVRNPFGNNKPIPKKVSTCGFESKPFIVGGTITLPREFPHMVT